MERLAKYRCPNCGTYSVSPDIMFGDCSTCYSQGNDYLPPLRSETEMIAEQVIKLFLETHPDQKEVTFYDLTEIQKYYGDTQANAVYLHLFSKLDLDYLIN